HRSVFVKFPLRTACGLAPGADPASAKPQAANLLIWTTTPWTLTSNVGAAVNPQLNYLKVKHKDEVYYLAKGAFTVQRLEEQFKRKEWVEGVPKLKTLEQFFKEKGGYEVVGEVKGADMVGWSYDGPFDELPAQNMESGYPAADDKSKAGKSAQVKPRDAHRVIAWDAVGETEGTGIVHIAPGCGKEDFELGRQGGLPPVGPLDDDGVFEPAFGALAGKSALDDATTDWILQNLQEKGVLFAVEKYPHSYPHCWRCKTELLFRLVDEWYINMSWRDEIMRTVEATDVTFLPESINGKARELDWLRNMGDWMISKKRFWGLALPIWVCAKDSGHFDVIGGREELQKRAVAGWDKVAGHSPHRPWIDEIVLQCPKCGGNMRRIPDVGNPWLDAGIVPFSTIKYNSDRAYWQKWFPADFITESFPGQFRNWFYAILAMSAMLAERAPFKVLLGHGQVRDQKGEEMHKSKGNAIPFEGAVNDGFKLFHEREPKLKLDAQAHRDLPEGWLPGSLKEETILLDNKPKLVVSASYPPMGADEIRWLYCRHNPALNINFGPEPAEELRSKFLLKLWNTYAFFCNYARLDGFDPATPQVPVAKRPDIDRWILSDLQFLIQKARKSFEDYNVMAFCLATEEFVDAKLSNWYVRINRRRFWKSEQGEDKLAAYQTLYTVLVALTKLCAPVIPFLAETMFRNLRTEQDLESVHLTKFPVFEDTLVDGPLSTVMDSVLQIVSLGRAVRNSSKIRVRQPLAELKVQPGSDADRQAVEQFADQICEELNIKKVTLHDSTQGPLLKFEVKLNMKNAGSKLGSRTKAVQTALASMVATALAEKVQAGQAVEIVTTDGPLMLEPADLIVSPVVDQGFAGLADRGTQLLLDARITPELALEGLAREVVRHVQNCRKEAGLQMEDRIVLYLGAEGKLAEAIQAYRDYIAAETLGAEWSDKPLGQGAYRAEVKIEGQPLVIELKRFE
ncbi:MAG: class I tRNA ligase family protein, partial [Gemmataceae bacterium]|nr:class I tRNA ligase family protein [Gemmataceae bacterium]